MLVVPSPSILSGHQSSQLHTWSAFTFHLLCLRSLRRPRSGSVQRYVVRRRVNIPEQPSTHGRWEAVTGGRIQRCIICSFSGDCSTGGHLWIVLLSPSFSMTAAVHSRIIFHINCGRPSFCLSILEEPTSDMASASYPVLWGSSVWLQRNNFPSLVCPSFPWTLYAILCCVVFKWTIPTCLATLPEPGWQGPQIPAPENQACTATPVAGRGVDGQLIIR